MQYQIPRYLNEQVRFVGLQSDEFCIVVLSIYFCAIFRFQWIVLFLNISMVVVFIWLNRNFPRGFVRHLAYFSGFYKFDHYPEFFANRFVE
jgi:type IV conjugative transfer system protein TraL